MKHWKAVYTRFPEHEDAERSLFFYGITALKEGQYEAAREAFKLYLKRYPDSRGTDRIRERELPRAEEKLQETRASQ
jgi:TolA-binding protein